MDEGMRFGLGGRTPPPAMHALKIVLDQLDLPSETLEAIWEDLTRGGMQLGMFYVGIVRRVPQTAYFLWHLSGEIPVSSTVALESLSHPMLARIAVEEFLIKWHQTIA